jgi:phospholipid transport system substrate-binding protein
MVRKIISPLRSIECKKRQSLKKEASMRLVYFYQGLLLFFLFFVMTIPAWAGEPTDQIKQTTDKILSIVTEPALKSPSKAEERRRLIREAVDERFDWEEMARRSLARYWNQRTPEEKSEFVRIYSDLLERTYLEKVEGYSGEKVVYEGESIEKEFAVVNVKIATKKKSDIHVQYRFKKEGNKWLIYDVSIEGVSLVNNYRTQFNSIILQSSYENLVKKLKEKVELK